MTENLENSGNSDGLVINRRPVPTKIKSVDEKGLLDKALEIQFAGLKAHKEVRVEFATFSVPKGSGIDLQQSFEVLLKRISGKAWRKIAWSAVWVGNPSEHVHVLWYKPYIRWNRLTAIWADIIHAKPQVFCRTVKGDKSKRNDVRRVVNYMIGQTHHRDDEGNELPIFFSHSQNWLRSPKLSKKQAKFAEKLQNTLEVYSDE